MEQVDGFWNGIGILTKLGETRSRTINNLGTHPRVLGAEREVSVWDKKILKRYICLVIVAFFSVLPAMAEMCVLDPDVGGCLDDTCMSAENNYYCRDADCACYEPACGEDKLIGSKVFGAMTMSATLTCGKTGRRRTQM